MSQDLDRPFEPISPLRRHTMRGGHPRLHRPPSMDPISIHKRRPLLSGGNPLLLVFVTGFGLYATGHLARLDRFFDRSQAFGRAHNDAVVHGVTHWLPAILVLSAAAVLATMAVFALRDRMDHHNSAAAIEERVLKVALVSVSAAAVHRTSPKEAVQPFQPGREPAEALPVTCEAITIHPFRAQPRTHPERDGATEQSPETLSAAVDGEVVAPPTAVALPAAVLPLSDPLPTLPAHRRVRRRDPRGTLPPAVAAALRLEVAALVK